MQAGAAPYCLWDVPIDQGRAGQEVCARGAARVRPVAFGARLKTGGAQSSHGTAEANLGNAEA
jgi:hypothetical protein